MNGAENNNYVILQNNPIYTTNENTEYTINMVVNFDTVKTHAFVCNRTEMGKGIAIFLANDTYIKCYNGVGQWNTGYVVPTNKKVNINIIKKSNEIAMYIDGKLIKISNEVGDKTALHPAEFTIGASQVKNPTTGVVGSYSNYLDGRIYLVNIYNKALTPEEIESNYEAEKKNKRIII